MTELTANGNLLGAAKSESDTAAAKVDTYLLDAIENKLGISQPVCELDLELEKCKAAEKEQTKEEEQRVTPPAAEPPPAAETSESKWDVGSKCQAVWSVDGKVYAATIVSLDGDQCRVRFNDYGNEEDMPLSTLKNPEEWKPGSHCRAVYSVDGLVYPAVVQWVKGQRCRVRFEEYNNEEEMDVSSLLGMNELNGPGRTGKGGGWRPGYGAGSGSRRRREETSDKRDRDRARDRGWKDDQQPASSWQSKERNVSQSRAEKDSDEKIYTDKTNQIFSVFPPFPPPPQSSGDSPTFVPPPPPLWAFGGKEPNAGLDPTSNMLMLWYMCGFHTGSYLAQQQFKSSSRD